MNKFMESISRTSHSVINKVKDHSPEILIGVGIVGGITSTVMACKATLKIDEVLAEDKKKINNIHMVANDPSYADQYNKEDEKKDLAITYTKMGLKLVKLYSPAIIVGAASIGCILYSNKILTKRNAAIVAAYTTIDTTFKDYRKRVVDRFGERIDQELRYDIKEVDIAEVEVDKETGEAKVVEKRQEDVFNLGDIKNKDIARFFDEASRHWVNSAEHNLKFLADLENWCTDKLRLQGRLTLNEVYDMLDIPRTAAGQVLGWRYDKNKKSNDVSFGIFEGNTPKARDFVNGYEKVVLLDFNIDGYILDTFQKK